MRLRACPICACALWLALESGFASPLRAQAPAPSNAAPVTLDLFPDGAEPEGVLSAAVARLNATLPGVKPASSPVSTSESDAGDWPLEFSEFLLNATMPNGHLPDWGENGVSLDVRGLLLRAADHFHREDFRWAATQGKKGKRPEESSFAYPQAGYFFLRSGWDPFAGYLALRNGPQTPNAHPDANSLILTAYGNELLIDPGGLPKDKPDAQTMARTLSRNTVTMDDRDTSPAAGQTTFVPGTILDYYDGTNSGYAGDKTDLAARHRRRILYIKVGLILMADDTTADQPHDWQLHFHFAPGQLIYRPTNQQLTYNVAVPVPSTTGAVDPNTADVARGPGGMHLWTSDPRKPHMDSLPGVFGKSVVASPALTWTDAQTKTAHFATFIEPFGENIADDQWIVRQDENNATVAVGPMDDPVQTVLLLKATSPPDPDAKPKFLSGVATDADAAVLRIVPRSPNKKSEFDFKDPQSSVFAVVNATRLVLRGLPLFASTKPVQRLEVIWQKDVMNVKVSGGETIQILTLKARWLIVNNKPRIAISPKSLSVTITP